MIADPTGKANLVLWEADINLGNTSFLQCGASVDDISDIEDVDDFVDDTNEQHCAKAASIVALNQFEKSYIARKMSRKNLNLVCVKPVEQYRNYIIHVLVLNSSYSVTQKDKLYH